MNNSQLEVRQNLNTALSERPGYYIQFLTLMKKRIKENNEKLKKKKRKNCGSERKKKQVIYRPCSV